MQKTKSDSLSFNEIRMGLVLGSVSRIMDRGAKFLPHDREIIAESSFRGKTNRGFGNHSSRGSSMQLRIFALHLLSLQKPPPDV
jgi:hypothetical protein